MPKKKKGKGLILGSGFSGYSSFKKTKNITVDINIDCKPDLIWDLNERPLPFKDNEFDIIYAFEVLEHLGRQGDWKGFFDEFGEYHRILKKLGLMIITVPTKDNNCFLSEPGHTRVLEPITFNFLSQDFYKEQIKESRCVTDYRYYWNKNFNTCHAEKTTSGDRWYIIIQKT